MSASRILVTILGPALGVVLASACAPSSALAQVSLEGVVVDEDGERPIASADVELVGESRRTRTTDDGRFSFARVSEGRHTVHIVAFGYHEADTVVVTATGALQVIRVALRREPIPLEEIVIAPGRFGILEASPTAAGITLSREDIEAVPQLGDDVLWTLRRMPGVASDDISSKLDVRGGAPRDVQFRLDGIELFEPYHLPEQDGALGVVDVQSLGSMELVTGGFPADFGGRMGGILDMRTREPPPDGTRTAVGMSISSLSFHSQGRFADGRGQWLATVRRGFLDIVLDITGVEDTMKPRYWDALGRVQFLVRPEHLVSVEVLHAGDDGMWSDPDDSGGRLESTWSSGYAWATWQASFRPGVRAETVVSVGRLTRDRTGSLSQLDDGVFTPLMGRMRDVASFDFAGIRQDWQVGGSDDVVLKAGFSLRYGTADYDYSSSASWLYLNDEGRIATRVDSTDVDVSPSGSEVGGYLAARARTGPALTWEAGLRYDGWTHTGDREVSPRVLARWDPDPRTSVKASWGRYAQGQRLYELHAADGEAGFNAAERAHQVAAGLERKLGHGLNGRVEVYHRRVDDAQPYFVNIARKINPLLELESDRVRIDPTRSRAQGIELVLAQERASPFSWSATYVLSKSEDEVEGIWVPRTLDQTHTLNLAAFCRLGRWWQFSASWQYHTGWPATNQILEVIVPEDTSGEWPRIAQRGFAPLNRERLSPYHRLDLRVMRGFGMGRSRLDLFLDVFNVYGRINYRGFRYNLVPSGTTTWRAERRMGEELLPRMPTVGFRWVF